MRASTVLWASLLWVGCGDPVVDNGGFATLVPLLTVAPDTLDFGDQTVPLPAELELYISNAGSEGDVSIRLEGDGAAPYALSTETATIPRGDTETLVVTFLPDTYLTFDATIVIETDGEDGERAITEVPLTGTGVAAPLPDIEVSSQTLEFGTADDGPVIELLEIRNVGGAPLTLGAIVQSGSGDFSFSYDPSGTEIAPGDDVAAVLVYAPPDELGDNGTLTIPSDDPDESEVIVQLLGNGGGDFVYPEAVIECPGVAAPPEYLTLTGYGSSDPEGQELTYAWTLTEFPQGSSAELTNNVSPTTDLFADTAGTFEVQLVVTNEVGTSSAPARCEIQAIPEDKIHVELTWDTPRADVNLHLAYGDATLFERPGDCSWCNKNPSWGASGTADDPGFDLDDLGGFGPENINILEPAAGTYDVRVHFFDDHGDDLTTATVRIYTNGELAAAPFSRVIDRNEVWDVARINWPAATVGTLSGDSYEAEFRQCQ